LTVRLQFAGAVFQVNKFKNANTHILAVSLDSLESHAKLIDMVKLHSPFLSDETTRSVLAITRVPVDIQSRIRNDASLSIGKQMLR